jgi:branched-chain amino acid transport system permease protein
MDRFMLSFIGGLTLGGTLALIGLGLVLAFRATHVFNFAHGQFLLLPAFIIGHFELKHVAFGPAVVLALAASTVIAVAFYWVVLRRTTGLSLFMGIIATLGLAAMMDGAMTILFPGGQYIVTVPGLPSGSVTILGAGISKTSLIFSLLTLVLAIFVVGIIRFTHLGLSIRASGRDPILASQCGLQVQRLHAGSWAVAGILAAIAGISYASTATASVSLIDLGLAALPAIMLGGLDSIEGAVIGGFLVGLMQGFTQTYLGGTYVNVVTYGLLRVVMRIYPQGLFGSKAIVRA